MPSTTPDSWLTQAEVLSVLQVARTTLFKWRTGGQFPEMVRMPNGELRIRKSVLEGWLDSLPEV